MTLSLALQKITEQIERVVMSSQLPTEHISRAAFERRMKQEDELRDVIDQACRQFADSGTLPIADAETSLFILDRFTEAAHCGRTLEAFATADGPWLTWLLIDYWSLVGVLRWSARVELIQQDREKRGSRKPKKGV